MAIVVARQLSEFNVQNVANPAWAFATKNYRDEKLFAGLAIAAERRLSEFNVKVANTAWAFATLIYRDEKLFAALGIVMELRLGE